MCFMFGECLKPNPSEKMMKFLFFELGKGKFYFFVGFFEKKTFLINTANGVQFPSELIGG